MDHTSIPLEDNKMAETQWIACTIENNGFSGERRFEVELKGQGKIVGVGSIQYLRDSENKPLPDDVPPYGQTVNGFVQYRILRQRDGKYVVEFPGSEIFHVPAEALTSHG